jgi:hypothetical protein
MSTQYPKYTSQEMCVNLKIDLCGQTLRYHGPHDDLLIKMFQFNNKNLLLFLKVV